MPFINVILLEVKNQNHSSWHWRLCGQDWPGAGHCWEQPSFWALHSLHGQRWRPPHQKAPFQSGQPSWTLLAFFHPCCPLFISCHPHPAGLPFELPPLEIRILRAPMTDLLWCPSAWFRDLWLGGKDRGGMKARDGRTWWVTSLAYPGCVPLLAPVSHSVGTMCCQWLAHGRPPNWGRPRCIRQHCLFKIFMESLPRSWNIIATRLGQLKEFWCNFLNECQKKSFLKRSLGWHQAAIAADGFLRDCDRKGTEWRPVTWQLVIFDWFQWKLPQIEHKITFSWRLSAFADTLMPGCGGQLGPAVAWATEVWIATTASFVADRAAAAAPGGPLETTQVMTLGRNVCKTSANVISSYIRE